MRRTFMLTAMALLLLAPLAAKEIVVLSPKSGDMLTQGANSYMIEWLKVNVSAQVKIQLVRQDGSLVGDIDSNTGPFHSPYKWLNVGMTTSGMAEPGQYKIRVITLNGNVWGDSRVFLLAAAAEPPPAGGGLLGRDLKTKHTIGTKGIVSPIIKPKPDLIVCKILPEVLDANEFRQALKLRVHNIGKGSSQECQLTVDFGGVQGKQKIRALPAGEFEEIFYEKANISGGVIKPTVAIHYTFHIDRDNLVMESDESNNVLSGTMFYYDLKPDPPRCSDGKSR